MSLTEELTALTGTDKLCKLIELAEKGQHVAIALIQWVPLPDKGATYSWFGMLQKRYGAEICQKMVISVLEAGTTMADFEDDRHFRSWFVASVKGRSLQIDDETGTYLHLEMYK